MLFYKNKGTHCPLTFFCYKDILIFIKFQTICEKRASFAQFF